MAGFRDVDGKVSPAHTPVESFLIGGANVSQGWRKPDCCKFKTQATHIDARILSCRHGGVRTGWQSDRRKNGIERHVQKVTPLLLLAWVWNGSECFQACGVSCEARPDATQPCSLSEVTCIGSVRILVVEDEVKLAGHVARALEHDGHDPRVAHDGKTGLVEARDGSYDLVVLDVELPRMDGFEVLKQLRELGVESRILMLTARGETPDRISGLASGADDYLTKPFAMNELLARVNALGQRFVASTGRILRVGDLTLKLDDREAWRGAQRIELTERECALLNVLMREPGRIFSRVELSERVWTREHEFDTKLVDVFIGRLRKKIDEGASEPLIKAVRHLGYTVGENIST